MSRLLALGIVLAPSAAWAADDAGGGSDLLVRVINVAILLGVLWLVARKPIQAFFAARRDEIAGEVTAAAELCKEAEERNSRFQRKLADLDTELDEIRRGSQDRAQAEKQRILEEARAAAERIRSDARAAVDQELRRARNELRKEASDLSVQLAAELLRNQVSDADRDRLMDEFISEVEQPGSGSGS
ncbi:MAG: ATP synthase F0 subunit B [Deltaproteobacteria bacterium]|nr:ATP synthase F0 subunit B [Deltaproteobacteria bacterium]MBW2360758.1 ATP synthase F0 subunit B [Deltaproteobacteria bacterium]